MLAVTIAAAALAAVTTAGLTAPLVLRRRPAAPALPDVAAPDLAAITRERAELARRADAVRRAQARAATVAAVRAIPARRVSPEDEPVMPALPVVPFVPAQRSGPTPR